MSFTPIFIDLVRNYTTTTGTGNLVVGKAVGGFTSFADALRPGDQFYYSVLGVEKTGETEVGRGTLEADGTIARSPIGGVATDFSAGLKTVSLVAAGEWFSNADSTIAAKAQHVADRAALAAAERSVPAAYLRESGREGMFLFDASDLSTAVAADTAQGIYVAPSSDPTGASGAWVRDHDGELLVHWFGISKDGVAGDYTGLRSHLATQTKPVRLRFAADGHFVVSSRVDFDLPHYSSVDAKGAYLEATHDDVMFDLNPRATASLPRTTDDDSVTKRGIMWTGGQFINSNGGRTGSVAIQAYFMRGFVLQGARMGTLDPTQSFYSFVKFGAKDTYHFRDCFTYGGKRHYWVPSDGVLFTPSLTGNDLISVTWDGCSMTFSGDQAGIYCDNRVMNLVVTPSCSFNGPSTVAHIYLNDNPTLYGRSVSIDGHFEQMGNGIPAVLLADGGGQGYYNVSIKGDFSSATAGWIGIKANRVRSLTVDALFTNGSGGAATAVQLDSNCRAVTIHDDLRYGGGAMRFLSVPTPIDLNGLSRDFITLVPEIIKVPGVALNDGATDLSGRVGGTLPITTVDMRAVSSVISGSPLPPVAYTISLRHSDSGSSTAGTAAGAYVHKSKVSTSFLGAAVGGVADNEVRIANGWVESDSNGDIAVSINSPATATTTMRLEAVYR